MSDGVWGQGQGLALGGEPLVTIPRFFSALRPQAFAAEAGAQCRRLRCAYRLRSPNLPINLTSYPKLVNLEAKHVLPIIDTSRLSS